MLPLSAFAGFASIDAAAAAATARDGVPAAMTDETLRAIGTGTPVHSVGGGAASDAGSCAITSPLVPLGALQCLPVSYGDLLGQAGVPGCFRTFAGKLGMNIASPLAHFLSIPEEDLVTTMQALIDEGAQLTADPGGPIPRL